jgi:N utilization substance protein B
MTPQNSSKLAKSVDSLEPLLQYILLSASYELMAHSDIDSPIIIADYLDVTHAFFDGGEAKLVNGILDRVKSAFRA